jgi:hypothetical protein
MYGNKGKRERERASEIERYLTNGSSDNLVSGTLLLQSHNRSDKIFNG